MGRWRRHRGTVTSHTPYGSVSSYVSGPDAPLTPKARTVYRAVLFGAFTFGVVLIVLAYVVPR